MATPTVDEIREEEQSGGNGDAGGVEDAGGTSGLSLSSLGLSRKHALIIGLIVVAFLVWKLKSEQSNTAADEVEKVRDGPDLGDVTVTEDDDQDEVEIRVPADPDDELAKDAAVIDALKEGGHIEGDD